MSKLILIGLVACLYQGCDFCMDGDEGECGRLAKEDDDYIPVRVTDPEELRRNLRHMEAKIKNALAEDKKRRELVALNSPNTTDEDRSPFDSPVIKKEEDSTSPRQNRSLSIPIGDDLGFLSSSFDSIGYNRRMSRRYSPERTSFMDFASTEREEVYSHPPVAHESLAEEQAATSDDNNSDIREQLFFGNFEWSDEESA